MELAEALDLVVAQTGHHRFRELLDPAHPDYNPGYGPVVLRMAAGLSPHPPYVSPPPRLESPRPTPPPTPAPPLSPEGQQARVLLVDYARLDVLVNACPHRGCKTGCGQAKCEAGKGDMDGGSIASIVHCRACVIDSAEPPKSS